MVSAKGCWKELMVESVSGCTNSELRGYIEKYSAKSTTWDFRINNGFVEIGYGNGLSWQKGMKLEVLCDYVNKSVYMLIEYMDENNIVDVKTIDKLISPWNTSQATIDNEICWNVLSKMTPFVKNVKGSLYKVMVNI